MKHYWYHYFNAIPTDKIDNIVENCLKEKLSKGTIGTGEVTDSKEEFVENLETRNSEICFLDIEKHEPLYKCMWKYALDANKFAYGFDIDNIETIQFSVYDSSYKGKYDWHIDTFWTDDSLFHRNISMVMQLSDPSEYEGGQFEISGMDPTDEERELMNQKGSIITIPSVVGHRVTPVTKGRRLSLIAWVEGVKFR
jgi:PKHD-type hydroxylase